MDVVQLKGVAAVCIWVCATLGGLLPFWLKRHAAQSPDLHDETSGHHSHEETRRASGASSSTDSSPQHVPGEDTPASALTTASTSSAHHSNDDASAVLPRSSSTGGGFRSSSLRTRHSEEVEARTALRRSKVSSDGGIYGSTSSPPNAPSRRGSLTHAPVRSESRGPSAASHTHTHRRCRMDVDRFLSLGNMLGAGIFLGGGLMHLLPESASGLAEVQASWPGFLSTFPLAFFLCGLGFWTILLVEEATIAITSRRDKTKVEVSVEKTKTLNALPSANDLTANDLLASPPMTDAVVLTVAGDVAPPVLLVPVPLPAPSGSVASARSLKRNLVQGLTPRLVLVADRVHTRVTSEGHEVVAECDSPSEAEAECEPGPISAFLEAAYNSPSPFPSLAARGRRAHHRCPGLEQSDEGSSGDEADVYLPMPAGTKADAVPPPRALRVDPELVAPVVNDRLAAPLLPAGSRNSSSSGDDDEVRRATKRKQRAASKSPVVMHAHIDTVKSDHGHGHGHGHGGHGHGHGHDDHAHFDISADTSYVVAYLLVLALSFHSIFEGIALGTQNNAATTVSIFIAIVAHTPLAGFALGVSLVKSRAEPRMALSCLFLFTITTPVGIFLGMILSYALAGQTLTLVSCCFQSFSAGTFLFVALEEIIPKELAHPKDKPVKLALAVVGFMAMASIKIFDRD